MFLLIFVVTAVPVICQDGGANDADSNAGLRRAPMKAANQGQSNHKYISKTELQLELLVYKYTVYCRVTMYSAGLRLSRTLVYRALHLCTHNTRYMKVNFIEF